jgi:hypothetical protein
MLQELTFASGSMWANLGAKVGIHAYTVAQLMLHALVHLAHNRKKI